MYSKTFIKDLLIIDALQNSDRDNPKTAREILEEVHRRLIELYPEDFTAFENEEDLTKAVTATISRHVQDMNSTGLYDIKTHRDNKLGYYNATEGKNFLFTPAEFAVIAIALYRTPSISTEETKELLKKFENWIGITGDMFSYAIVKKQIDQWSGIRRKTARRIFPIITELLKAVIEARKITFNLYERSFNDASEEISLQKRIKTRKKDEEIIITYKVSPYFLVWENDECYLIGHDPKNDTPEGQQFSHFKISLIANLKILDEKITPLRKIDFYARYAMEPHSYYTDSATRERLAEIENILQSDTRETTFKNFSLDRYMREHIYMVTNDSPTVDVTIEFDKDFLETIFTQLTSKQKVTPSANNKGKWQTIMTVQDNDGLYQWLLRYSDKVKVISPKKIRDKLRQRLNAALDNLNG